MSSLVSPLEHITLVLQVLGGPQELAKKPWFHPAADQPRQHNHSTFEKCVQRKRGHFRHTDVVIRSDISGWAIGPQ